MFLLRRYVRELKELRIRRQALLCSVEAGAKRELASVEVQIGVTYELIRGYQQRQIERRDKFRRVLQRFTPVGSRVDETMVRSSSHPTWMR